MRISSDEFIMFSQIFKSEKIEFFDSELNTLLDKKNTIFLKKKIWIQNIFIFIQQIKNIIIYKKNKIVHVNFLTYLKNAVQWWYSDKLNKQDKITLRIDINQ